MGAEHRDRIATGIEDRRAQFPEIGMWTTGFNLTSGNYAAGRPRYQACSRPRMVALVDAEHAARDAPSWTCVCRAPPWHGSPPWRNLHR
jgi:hypothetical protein